MRILQAMAGAEVGGAEGFFVRLVAALAKRGIEQRALIRNNSAGRAATLAASGITVATAPFGGILDFRTRSLFRREIDAFHPDIVLTWMNRATRFCPHAISRRFVHVGTPRGYYDPKYFRHCDRLIVTTADLARFYGKAGWPEDRIASIPNFSDDTHAPPVARSEFDTPPHAPLVLALGRLHQNKGFDTLLRAIALLPEHYLWIAGEGPLARELAKLCGDLGISGRVRLLGWRDDVPALFAACDAFACPSRHEPFGNIVIEAWVHRVPIVAAASEGPGALIVDGTNGLLVPIDEPAALAAAFRRLTVESGLAETLAAGGRAAYEREFTESAVVDRYLEFFTKVSG